MPLAEMKLSPIPPYLKKLVQRNDLKSSLFDNYCFIALHQGQHYKTFFTTVINFVVEKASVCHYPVTSTLVQYLLARPVPAPRETPIRGSTPVGSNLTCKC